ncbi:MAG: pyridoxine 5'-phosphate synthase, partial [Myxococcota bacterium]
AATQEMVKIAYDVKPDMVTLVPERREELTTEGGLDISHHRDHVKKYVQSLKDGDIQVSVFIDPDLDQVRAAHRVEASAVEIHTGKYAVARGDAERRAELQRIADAARAASKLGMGVAAGHGLHFHNLQELVLLNDIEEYNIGHGIVAKAIFVGLERAVRDMLELLSP